ncbi:hypothetical protein Franean1_2767 [Parafrankia sp. EAN1pec]|nr:hypothetical protein Franean1_2767 [Frankia sp. EAN1pec]
MFALDAAFGWSNELVLAQRPQRAHNSVVLGLTTKPAEAQPPEGERARDHLRLAAARLQALDRRRRSQISLGGAVMMLGGLAILGDRRAGLTVRGGEVGCVDGRESRRR